MGTGVDYSEATAAAHSAFAGLLEGADEGADAPTLCGCQFALSNSSYKADVSEGLSMFLPAYANENDLITKDSFVTLYKEMYNASSFAFGQIVNSLWK